jgi:photosystem II stability/assembly factor-like uncharacterized protein
MSPRQICRLTVAACLLLAAASTAVAQDNSWRALGPEGGEIVALEASPISGRVWAATDEGGIWRSDDGGTTWTAASGGLDGLVCHDLAADPGNPERAWVATESGVWRTVDGGATWRRTSLRASTANDQRFTLVEVAPSSPETLYASGPRHLWRSVDGGDSWGQVTGRLPADRVVALAVHPTDPSIVLASPVRDTLYRSPDGGLDWVRSDQGIDRVPVDPEIHALAFDPSDPATVFAAAEEVGGTGIYRSRDAGVTWELVAPQFDGTRQNQPAETLAVSADGTTVLAGGPWGLFRSADGGDTWRRDDVPPSPLGVRPVEAVLWLPGSSTEALAGTPVGGVLRSGDIGGAGDTWRASNAGLDARPLGLGAETVGGVVHLHPGLVADPRANGRLYALSQDFQLSGSTDWGGSWRRLDAAFPGVLDTPRVAVVDLRLVPTDPDVLFARVAPEPVPVPVGASPLFLLRSLDAGQSWESVGDGLPGLPDSGSHALGVLHWDPRNPGALFLRFGQTVYRSPDRGDNWSPVIADLPAPETVVPLDQIAPVDGSVDGGGGGAFAWVDVSGEDTCIGLGCPPPAPQRALFWRPGTGQGWTALEKVSGSFDAAVFASPTEPGVLLRVEGGDLHRSTDGGADFAFYLRTPLEPLGSRPRDGWPVDELIDPRDGNVVYEARFGPPAVRRSDDGGETWEPFTDRLQPSRARALVLVPFDGPGPRVLLATTPAGVWARPLDGDVFPPPAGDPITSAAFPDFRFWFQIDPGDGSRAVAVRAEPRCLPGTLCVSGALPGRVEVLGRVIGPRPNGFLWPVLVKLTTSEVRVWIEQISTGDLQTYLLPGARPGMDELLGLFDRTGFEPSALAAKALAGGPVSSAATEPPPPGPWLTTAEVPGFRFKVEIGEEPPRTGAREPGCLAETLCVSGALAGRTEVLVRVVGPRPNRYFWPLMVKLTPAEVDVWIERTETGEIQHYRLPAAEPGSDLLEGLFDRRGFQELPRN